MEENIQFTELEQSLLNLRQLTDKITKNLDNYNRIITENINSGVGVWDSEMAGFYRQRWESVMEEFPSVIEIFQTQSSNLEQYIKNMKGVDE